jgi:hypothetical protein
VDEAEHPTMHEPAAPSAATQNHIGRLRDFAARTQPGDSGSDVPPLWPETDPVGATLRRKDP